jgi:glutamyl-Q tRNA(Asp) synthetase
MEVFRGGPLAPEEEARRLAAGAPFAWRLSLGAAEAALGGFAHLKFLEEGEGPAGERGPIALRPELGGDVVLARKDVGVAYHLAVAHDDALQGVAHVIRGQDLFEATHVPRLLQALMGWPAPVYRHHRLLTGPDGRRFAKRDKAETLRELRATGATGATAQAIRRELEFD